jgi:hypothetical protein
VGSDLWHPLYLVGLSSLRRRNLGSWNTQRVLLAAALIAATPVLGILPAAAVVAVVATACAALVGFERVRFGVWRRNVLGECS